MPHTLNGRSLRNCYGETHPVSSRQIRRRSPHRSLDDERGARDVQTEAVPAAHQQSRSPCGTSSWSGVPTNCRATPQAVARGGRSRTTPGFSGRRSSNASIPRRARRPAPDSRTPTRCSRNMSLASAARSHSWTRGRDSHVRRDAFWGMLAFGSSGFRRRLASQGTRRGTGWWGAATPHVLGVRRARPGAAHARPEFADRGDTADSGHRPGRQGETKASGRQPQKRPRPPYLHGGPPARRCTGRCVIRLPICDSG